MHFAGVGDAAVAVADGDEVLEGMAEAVDDDEAAVFEGIDHFGFLLFLDLFFGRGDAGIEEDLAGVVGTAGDACGFPAFAACEGVIAVACEDLVEGDGTAYGPLFGAETAGAERVFGNGVVAVFALVLFDDGGDGGDAVERLLFLAFADGELEASEAHGTEECHDGDDRHDFDEGEGRAAAGGGGRFHGQRAGVGAEGAGDARRGSALELGDDRDEWLEEREHDDGDDDGEDDDHDRFEEGGEGADGVIDFVVIDVGDFEEHFGELPGFLTDFDHGDDHGWEDFAGVERCDHGFAFFDGVMDLHDGFCDDGIAGGVAGDVEGLEDGNAGGDESPEGTGEASDGAFEEDGPEEREFEDEFVENAAAVFGGAEGFEAHDGEEAEAAEDVPVGLHEVAGTDDGAGEGGHLAGTALDHVFEDFGEFRDDVGEEEDDDPHGDDDDDHRVDHGGDDLVFEFLGLFLVFGETVEDEFEDPAEFTGFDHVDVELIEDLGVLGEAF